MKGISGTQKCCSSQTFSRQKISVIKINLDKFELPKKKNKSQGYNIANNSS